MKNLSLLFLVISFGACSPTVKVQPPDKPVEINLNVKIDHNIKVKVDKELENVIKENEDIF